MDTTVEVPAHHKKLHTKRSFGKHPKLVDSPAYDASEEDNDPLTDDASAVSVPVSRFSTPNANASNSTSRPSHLKPSRVRHQLASSLLSDSDGVDSPTYDGDIESSTTAGPDNHSVSSKTSHHHPSSSVSTINTPMSSEFPSSSTVTLGERATKPNSSHPVFISQPVNVAAVPLLVPEEPAVTAVSEAAFNPAALSAEDIQTFIQKAIEGEPSRPYKINPPPAGRPVRIYADGVYDLFHFGHALQLRQAKLSFPSVYLLVGVCSDEIVKAHKFRSIMTHAERCEAARHCRWVDEIVPEAPWVIDADFVDKWELDYVAHDEEAYPSAGHEDVYAYAKSQGKFLPTRRTPGVSTSELLERIVSGYRKRDFDDKLVKMGHAELKAEGSDYDDSSRNVSRSISPVIH